MLVEVVIKLCAGRKVSASATIPVPTAKRQVIEFKIATRTRNQGWGKQFPLHHEQNSSCRKNRTN